MFSARTVRIRHRRLPHWTAEEGTYFVTFRLHDALSPELERAIRSRTRYHRLADRFLDRAHGRCWLRDARIAELVEKAIRYFDGRRYVAHAWTVMPNHVHAAIRTLPGFDLERITRGWKGYTGREANRMLQRCGVFWQTESYDSLLHDQHDLDGVIRYIEMNPVKAGYNDWPWTVVLRREFSFGNSFVFVP